MLTKQNCTFLSSCFLSFLLLVDREMERTTGVDTKTKRLRARPKRGGRRRSSGVARPVVPAHETSTACQLCDIKVSRPKHHFMRIHVPHFVFPFTACWTCGLQCARESCLEKHLATAHQEDPIAQLNAGEVSRWAYHTLGFLYALASAFGLVSLQALQAFVESKGIKPETGLCSPLERRAQEQLGDASFYWSLGGEAVHSQQKAAKKLYDWKVLQALLALKPGFTFPSGPMDLVGVHSELQEHTRRFDAHFHLDRMITAGTHCGILPEGVHGAVASYCFPEYWPLQPSQLGEDRIRHCFGIHPSRVDLGLMGHEWPFLLSYLTGPRAVAVGEVGLDYKNSQPSSARTEQQRVLRQCLDLAGIVKKPVVLHCRGDGALPDLIELLRDVLDPFHPLYFHCFTYSPSQLSSFLSSFPNTIFGFSSELISSPHLAELISLCSLAHIVLETDAPNLAKGPGMLDPIASAIAEKVGCSTQCVLTATACTAARFYNVPL